MAAPLQTHEGKVILLSLYNMNRDKNTKTLFIYKYSLFVYSLVR